MDNQEARLGALAILCVTLIALFMMTLTTVFGQQIVPGPFGTYQIVQPIKYKSHVKTHPADGWIEANPDANTVSNYKLGQTIKNEFNPFKQLTENMNADEKARFKQLAEQYNLAPTDFWKSPQGFVIISRRGIEKIQSGLGATISYDVVPEFSDLSIPQYVIKATGKIRSKTTGTHRSKDGGHEFPVSQTVERVVETFGEANPKNCRGGAQAYMVAMSEKRAMARCILKLSDFYMLNVFSEDEIDE